MRVGTHASGEPGIAENTGASLAGGDHVGHLRLLLGLLILAVGIRFAIELVIRPDELFTIRETGGTG